LITLICLAPLAYWVEGFAADWTLPFVFSIVWLGVVVSILSFFLMLHLIRTRNAARVSSLQYFVPPVTMMIAWPVFGEALSLLGFMGLFITAGGFSLSIVASRLWRSKKARIYRVLQYICLQGI